MTKIHPKTQTALITSLAKRITEVQARARERKLDAHEAASEVVKVLAAASALGVDISALKIECDGGDVAKAYARKWRAYTTRVSVRHGQVTVERARARGQGARGPRARLAASAADEVLGYALTLAKQAARRERRERAHERELAALCAAQGVTRDALMSALAWRQPALTVARFWSAWALPDMSAIESVFGDSSVLTRAGDSTQVIAVAFYRECADPYSTPVIAVRADRRAPVITTIGALVEALQKRGYRVA